MSTPAAANDHAAVDPDNRVGDVCLGRPAVDTLLDAHVDPAIADLKPEAAPALEAIGLLDLRSPSSPQ